jgi:hypothetical protein
MLYPIAIATWYQGTETKPTNKQKKILLAEHEQCSEPSWLIDTYRKVVVSYDLLIYRYI